MRDDGLGNSVVRRSQRSINGSVILRELGEGSYWRCNEWSYRKIIETPPRLKPCRKFAEISLKVCRGLGETLLGSAENIPKPCLKRNVAKSLSKFCQKFAKRLPKPCWELVETLLSFFRNRICAEIRQNVSDIAEILPTLSRNQNFAEGPSTSADILPNFC